MNRVTAGLVLGIAASLSAAQAADVPTAGGAPGTLVNVSLGDAMSTHPDLSKDLGLGIGMKGDMSTAAFRLAADTFAVPAGLVTFRVTNTSDHMQHAMLVVPIADMSTPLPYDTAQNRVDEKAAHALGEVDDLAPGKTGELTLDLKPGLYAMLCNIAGHYGAGMWRVLAVQ